MSAPDPRIYVIDGRVISSAADFYREIGEAVNGPGGYFGKNLDALADCLRGGFGTPVDRPFRFCWQHSARSRELLQEDPSGDERFAEAVGRVFAETGVELDLT